MENRETTEPQDQSLAEKSAIAWFTRINGNPTRAEKRDFATWLEMSPENKAAYQEVSALWSDIGAVADSVAKNANSELDIPMKKIEDFRRKKWNSKSGALIAGCIMAFFIGAWVWVNDPSLLQNMTADYSTIKGERRLVTLTDGSTILMNADTALDADISTTMRRIHLLRGNAYFTVQKNGAPFVVQAGNGEARVLGTQFDVGINGNDDVTVTVAEGSVEVSAVDETQKAILKPGESIEYDRAGLGTVNSVDIAERLAWHEGRLIFDNARLGDVLAQIERYQDGRIVVLSSELKNRRVSGNISLDKTMTTLEAMHSSVGFRMTNLVGKVIVISP